MKIKHVQKFRNPRELTTKNYNKRWTEFKREAFRLCDHMIVSGVKETKVVFINGFDLILRDRKRKRVFADKINKTKRTEVQ